MSQFGGGLPRATLSATVIAKLLLMIEGVKSPDEVAAVREIVFTMFAWGRADIPAPRYKEMCARLDRIEQRYTPEQ